MPEIGFEIHSTGIPINPYTGEIDVGRTPVAGVLRGIDQPGTQGARIFDQVLRDTLIPPIQAIWPRRTGYSGDTMDFNAGRLESRAPYAPAVEARGRYAELAVETNIDRAAAALDAEVQRIIDRGGPTTVARLGRLRG
ncbi:hypothetical protein F4Y93_12220 [Candidatus Poribacteria bacterium]|nr:hypothetical protein [Candidatus Poribacteria bacterium]